MLEFLKKLERKGTNKTKLGLKSAQMVGAEGKCVLVLRYVLVTDLAIYIYI